MQHATALAFDERLGLLVEAEWIARENKRLGRALQEAKLKLPQACLEAIDYPARRELDKAVIRQLATCRWIDEHHNVILVGATGVGKSFVACALAHQAPEGRAVDELVDGAGGAPPESLAKSKHCRCCWPNWQRIGRRNGNGRFNGTGGHSTVRAGNGTGPEIPTRQNRQNPPRRGRAGAGGR